MNYRLTNIACHEALSAVLDRSCSQRYLDLHSAKIGQNVHTRTGSRCDHSDEAGRHDRAQREVDVLAGVKTVAFAGLRVRPPTEIASCRLHGSKTDM
jgi:hypothetical protein